MSLSPASVMVVSNAAIQGPIMLLVLLLLLPGTGDCGCCCCGCSGACCWGAEAPKTSYGWFEDKSCTTFRCALGGWLATMVEIRHSIVRHGNGGFMTCRIKEGTDDR